jgi:formylglycine-generating enzyme required for sulfatase activity
MEFVWVPPGEFVMGSENGRPSEKPVHRVTISEGFYLGKYEVTWAQWRQVMGGRGAGFDNYPVDGVTWDGAQEFIKRLNASGDGFTYRLPSESEWEYAARAGAVGDAASNLDDVAWYVKNSGREELKEEELNALDERKLYDRLRLNMNSAHPVEGTRRANAFGLYHMLGNVREWVEDWYHETYEGAPADGRAWVTGGAQRYRVLRGGAAIDGAFSCRFTTRMEFPAAAGYVPYTFCGFRVVARPRAGRFILGLTTR